MDVSRLAAEALALTLLLSLPALATSLVVGLLVSLFQAVTQLQDQTITFVPKLLAVALVLLLTGPALGAELARFTSHVFLALPETSR